MYKSGWVDVLSVDIIAIEELVEFSSFNLNRNSPRSEWMRLSLIFKPSKTRVRFVTPSVLFGYVWSCIFYWCTSEILLKPLNAELNLICHLLALFGANHILHVSRIRVKTVASVMKLPDITHQFLHILLNTIMLMTRCKCYLNYNAHTCDMGPNVIQQKKWLFMYFTWDKRHPHLCSKVHHEGRQVDQTNE